MKSTNTIALHNYNLSTAALLFFMALLLCSCSTTGILKDQNKTRIPLELLKETIGKNIDSNEVLQIKKIAGIRPEVNEYDEGRTVFLIWGSHGVELLFEKNKVRTVFLYSSSKRTNYSEYRGELPEGLLFTDSRYDVEKKLGLPDYIAGGEVIEVWVDYKKLKLGIFYKSSDLKDMSTKIEYLSIQ